jgi:hypothetical protein
MTSSLVASGNVFPFRRVLLTCWLIYAAHWAPYMIREHYPAVTLARYGTLNVQRYLGFSEDIFAGPRGGAFINNNPGASIIGALPLIPARPLLAAVERWNDALPSSIARSRHAEDYETAAAVHARREWYFMLVAFLTMIGVMAPLSALCAAWFGGTLHEAGVSRVRSVAAAFAFAFATPVFLRTTYLNHNLLVCHAGLLAGLLLWNHGKPNLSFGRAAGAGALGGFALLCDYSGAFVLAFTGIYAWLRAADTISRPWDRLPVAVWFGAGALPLLLALALYQQWAFGYSALPSQAFMTPIAETSRGYRGLDWPSLEIAWMNFFDSRFGLFAVCPMLILGLAAPFVKEVRFRLPWRETGVILGFFVALTLFCAANQYSRLQGSTGLRYLVPVVPGLLLLSLQVLQRLPSAIARACLATSFLVAWIPAAGQDFLIRIAAHPQDFQLSWLRRMWEFGAVVHPIRDTWIVFAVVATGVACIWLPSRSLPPALELRPEDQQAGQGHHRPGGAHH